VNGSLPRIMVDRRRERARERLLDALVWRGSTAISVRHREDLKRLVARWAARDFEPGFADVEELEIACAQERERKEAEAAGDPTKLFALQEQAHRRAIVAAYGSIEIRGLQMSARVHQDLDVAFVPLHIEDPSQAREVELIEVGLSLRHIPRLDVVEIIKRHDRVLLVGAPGSGKTTLVSYLAASAAAGKLREKAGWNEDPVPFVVPVRSLSKPLLDAETIAGIAGCEVAFVQAVLEQKRALLLVDGLDEAGSDRLRALVPSIQRFAKACPGNTVLLTTRPAAGTEDERARVEGFETTRLLALTRDEVYLFIDRWCLAAELSIQRDKQKAREDAERASADLKSRVQTSRAVERLAETPLMASVLCIVHRFLGQRVPERRAALYEACTNVLLYEWDRAKFPEGSSIGRLDAEMKRILLGCVAREMHINELAEISRDQVIKQFSSRLSMFVGHSAEEARGIVAEIQERSGVLVERRPGFYAFSHLTFQEYLTAVELMRDRDYTFLVRQCDDPWWHEVIALAAGLPGVDAALIVRGLLAHDGDKIASGTMLAAQCIETAIEMPASLRQDVESRVARLIPPRSEEDIDAIIEFGEVAGPVLLRAIAGADANGRAWIAVALGRIAYEPASGALARLMSDSAMTTQEIPLWLGNFRTSATDCNVSLLAASALLTIAFSSESAQTVLRSALPTADIAALRLLGVSLFEVRVFNVSCDEQRKFYNQVLILANKYLHERSRVKAASPGKRSSKRGARSG